MEKGSSYIIPTDNNIIVPVITKTRDISPFNGSDSTILSVDTIIPNPDNQNYYTKPDVLINNINNDINNKLDITNDRNTIDNINNNTNNNNVSNSITSPTSTITLISSTNDCNSIEDMKINKNSLKKENTTNVHPTKIINIDDINNENRNIKKFKIPIYVIFGGLQLILSITLVGLGGLLLARGTSLSYLGVGIWTGGIAGITGSLGIMNVSKVQTAFLATSLICVASSTLGLALTGIGLVRDTNLVKQEETTWGAVTSGSGLIFVLSIHFLISVFSVYNSVMRLCLRSTKQRMLENIAVNSNNNNHSILSQQKVEEYIKSITDEQNIKGMIYQNMIQQQQQQHQHQLQQQQQQYHHRNGHQTLTNEKFGSANSQDKLIAIWVGGNGKQNQQQQKLLTGKNKHLQQQHNQQRQIVLVPAALGNGAMPPMYPGLLPQAMYQPISQLGMLPPGVHPFGPYGLAAVPISNGTGKREKGNRRKRSSHSTKTANNHQQLYMLTKASVDNENNRKQRRKSDTDADNNRKKAFTYTGLDRSIAENFLERQEESNHQHNSSNTNSNGYNSDVYSYDCGPESIEQLKKCKDVVI